MIQRGADDPTKGIKTRNTYEKALAGHYKSKLPSYTASVARPYVLTKMAGDLTSEEIASLQRVCKEHADAVYAVKEARTAHNKDNQRLVRLQKADLEAENGLAGHPKAERLWDKACEHGDSASGLAEIVRTYESLVDLVKD